MPQDQGTFISAHLGQTFPGVSPQVIEDFVLSCAWKFDRRPSSGELNELEDQFTIHLTLLSSAEPQPEQHQPSQSMDDLAERPVSRMDEEFVDDPNSRAVDILNILQISFEKEENFKHLCNTIFKGVKFFVQDPTNKVFATFPLLYSDMEDNDGIITQIQYLCCEFNIDFAPKEKGALLTFRRTDSAYVNEVSQLLNAFKKHKDEMVQKKPIGLGKKGAFNGMDPNREERVAAFLEARKQRSQLSQNSMNSTPPVQNEIQGPGVQESPHLHKSVSLPSQNVNTGPSNVAVQTPTPQPKKKGHNGMDPNRDERVAAFHEARQRREMNANMAAQNQVTPVPEAIPIGAESQGNAQPMRSNWAGKPADSTKGSTDKSPFGEPITNSLQLAQQIDIEDRWTLGKLCLDWTNKFREMNKLKPLEWEQSMFDIGRHSSFSFQALQKHGRQSGTLQPRRLRHEILSDALQKEDRWRKPGLHRQCPQKPNT